MPGVKVLFKIYQFYFFISFLAVGMIHTIQTAGSTAVAYLEPSRSSKSR